MKKKILLIYSEMMLGGSTTSILSFMNSIDTKKYEVDLQLYKNQGELFEFIPEHVNILPQAFAYEGRLGNLVKKIIFVLSGFSSRAQKANKKLGQAGYSGQVLAEFQAKYLSRKNSRHYDYAIGFIEGWSDRYLAYCVNAEKKYGWIHSTFQNIAPILEEEHSWIERIDNIVFVAKDCRDDFAKLMPIHDSKAITIENLFDSEIIRKRSEKLDSDVKQFTNDNRFKIVTICRLWIETKGLDRIVNCAKVLKHDGYDFAWYIVGDGKDRQAFENLIKDADVQDRIILLGMQKNPYPFLAKCNVMCMPSRWEGKPMTVTEAKILGVPPVVTEYLSAREQIMDAIEGIVVENTEESIIPVLRDLLDHPEKCIKMKEYLLSHEYGNSAYMREIEKMILQ